MTHWLRWLWIRLRAPRDRVIDGLIADRREARLRRQAERGMTDAHWPTINRLGQKNWQAVDEAQRNIRKAQRRDFPRKVG